MNIRPKRPAPKNSRLLAVFGNELFQKEALLLRDMIIEQLLEKGLLESTNDFLACNREVLLASLGENFVKEYDQFLKENLINDDEFWYYFGLNSKPVDNVAVTITSVKDEPIQIEPQVWAKEKDITAAWKSLKPVQQQREGYVGKRKTPEDLQLLLAIHKARLSDPKKTFRQLSQMINSDTLPGYNRVLPNKDYDESYLRKYYHAHKSVLDK